MSVLVMGLSPLASHQNIRRHFAAHGSITSFEPQIDKVNGGALGIVLIGYGSHENAKRCVEREHGKKPTPATGLVAPGTEVEEIKVVFDGEGKKLRAVLKELDERKRQEREERRRREKMKESSSALRSTPSTTAGQTPQPWRHGQPTPSDRQQSNGSRPPPGSHRSLASDSRLPPKPQQNGSSKHAPRQPPMSLIKARLASARPVLTDAGANSHESSLTPVHPRGRNTWRYSGGRSTRTLSPVSRSPSPVLRRPGESSRNARQKEHEAVVEELAKNGFDYVTIDSHGAQLSGAVSEDDVKQFFDGFKVDKVRLISFARLCATQTKERSGAPLLLGCDSLCLFRILGSERSLWVVCHLSDRGLCTSCSPRPQLRRTHAFASVCHRHCSYGTRTP